MLGRTNHIGRMLKLLFAPSGKDTLTASGGPGTGGRRMGRRVALLAIAALILGGLGYAAYAILTSSPDRDLVEEPTLQPTNKALPTAEEFARLAEKDPVAMFEACLLRYEREGVKGFTATLDKQERVKGTLNEREIVRVVCAGELPEKSGEHPKIRVRMVWESGFRKVIGIKNLGTLYVVGANKNQMQTYTSLGTEMAIDPRSSLSRGASRYSITDGGLYRGMLRTYDAWKKRHAAGELNAKYIGIESHAEVGGRPCYVIRRTCTTPEVDSFALDEAADAKANPQRDGATEVTAYIDVERWLHVGTVLKRADSSLLGHYYFRDVELTKSEFSPDPFTMDALKAATKK